MKSLKKQMDATDLPCGSVAIWSLGQSGVIIKGSKDDGAICIDPYLTDCIEKNKPGTEFVRAFPAPFAPEELSALDGVIITHEHDDHLDPCTLKGIAKTAKAAKFAVPPAHRHLLPERIGEERIIAACQNQRFSIGGFRITPIAVAHDTYVFDADGNAEHLGYLIEGNGVKLFHSGDTIVDEKIVETVAAFAPDIVFLPINGGDYARTRRGIIGNMNFREACDFSDCVQADMLIPIHFDLFPNNTDNPAYFVDYLFHTYPNQKFHMMVAGERFVYFSSRY
ncbi:MAG TPA: MBL fold metallo-hydrolase [Bacillales bacterium]|nr:MBL fold metallo-hydrolase [Bacillales bacterium]